MLRYLEGSRCLDRPRHDSVGASSPIKVTLDIVYRLVGMCIVWKADLGLQYMQGCSFKCYVSCCARVMAVKIGLTITLQEFAYLECNTLHYTRKLISLIIPQVFTLVSVCGCTSACVMTVALTADY